MVNETVVIAHNADDVKAAKTADSKNIEEFRNYKNSVYQDRVSR